MTMTMTMTRTLGLRRRCAVVSGSPDASFGRGVAWPVPATPRRLRTPLWPAPYALPDPVPPTTGALAPMNWHWTGLVFFSLTLFPAGLALVTGRIPRHLRYWLAPMRPRGWALLALYSVAPLNAIPRLADAPSLIILVATAAAGVVAAVGCTYAALAPRRTRNATT